jgi:hypothetical protein
MQQKNLQSLLSNLTAQPEAHQEAELLTQELASQLKSGSAFPADGLLTAEPTGLWRLVSPWLHRLERAVTPASRASHLVTGQPHRPD